MKKSLATLSLLAFGFAFSSCVTEESIPADDSKLEVSEEKPEKDISSFSVDEKTGTVKFDVEVIYFAFDDHILTQEGQTQLNALRDYLKKNPNLSLVIEGHADHRGSNEYNLALGDSRAFSCKNYLSQVGVQDGRVKTVSYGEERPAMEGNGEDAWSQNRRAEFRILDKSKDITPLAQK